MHVFIILSTSCEHSILVTGCLALNKARVNKPKYTVHSETKRSNPSSLEMRNTRWSFRGLSVSTIGRSNAIFEKSTLNLITAR